MGIFLGVSRAPYYGWESRLEQEDPDRDRMALVQEAYEASHKIYGYRRITLWLKQKHALVINPKAVLRLMNKLNIRSRARKRKMYKNLEEIGIYHRYPNVLNRDFVATRPNQKWVTDNALRPFRVTYVMTQEGWAYLSVIKDLYDGFIVASAFDRNNSIASVTAF